MLVKNFYKMLAQSMLNTSASIVTNGAGNKCEMKTGTTDKSYLPFFSGSYYGPEMSRIRTSPGNGVFFSSDTDPTTFDRYAFESNHYNMVSGFHGSATLVEQTVTETYAEIKVRYTITNNSTEIFDIRCVSLYCLPTGSSADLCLIERTVLETPVVIEPNQVGQVEYTIRFDYPTA